MIDKLQEAVDLAESGRLEEAKSAFEEVLLDDPRNAEALFNLGMCFTELGEPQRAITALSKSIDYNPEHSNSYVALGYAYDKLGDEEAAIKHLLLALSLDPDNPYAMRNLGGVFGKSGEMKEALSYLQKAYEINPSDAATVYGLAYCCQQLEDHQKADGYYRRILDMDAPLNIKELARDGLREIAVVHLKSKGLRTDAVMYMLSALKRFEEETDERVREISFEIAMKGRRGLDINNPDRKYTIHSMPGTFSGLQLVSYMYVGFQRIDANQDIGIDLSQEYEEALRLFEDREKT